MSEQGPARIAVAVKPLSLDSIRLDGDTQPRAEIDEGLVAEYAEAMEDEAEFPPVVVFHDGADYWLADGFHRYHAMRRVGLTGCRPDVRQGTRRDAILYSVGANAQHGKRRMNADKRKAVLTLLGDEEWTKWSDREIARRCGVTHPFVGQLRTSLETVTSDDAAAAHLNPDTGDTYAAAARTYTTRHGTVATMDTTNIGRQSTERSAPPPVERQERHPPAEISDAFAFAGAAISQLERIRSNDPHRREALLNVRDWINATINSEEAA